MTQAYASLKRLIVGKPIPTSQAGHQRLTKTIALAVFSSDALSSNAYATQELLTVLALAGVGAFYLTYPLALAIVGLLAILTFSYRQTIRAYPNGGGAYIVAHENLGRTAGLVAASSLLIDYILTVSVSVAAAVQQITSLLPGAYNYRLILAVAFVALVAILNLRGVKESGRIFAVPTYLFVFSVLLMIVVGLAREVMGQQFQHFYHFEAPGTRELTLFLALRAFGSGTTALTGVEAISNGVPAFRKPEWRNASATLTVMAGLLATMFLGITYLAHHLKMVPDESEKVSVLAQIAKSVFGGGNVLWWLLLVATAAILVLAANTAFADFPRLAQLLARDRYLPGQFKNRGDRLVFSNGIVVLGLVAVGLLWLFDVKVSRLINLYVIGVFTSFTLSQAGMVVHWRRLRNERHWRRSMLVNGFGAVLTTIVLGIQVAVKFRLGAWMVVVAVPILMLAMVGINRHYRHVGRQLSPTDLRLRSPARITALVLVSDLHRASLRAMRFAASLRPSRLRAICVDLDSAESEALRRKWAAADFGFDIDLEIVESQFREITRPIVEYIHYLEPSDDHVVVVVIPEFVVAHAWDNLLHNQTALQLKIALLSEPGVVVISVPYHIGDDDAMHVAAGEAPALGAGDAKRPV